MTYRVITAVYNAGHFFERYAASIEAQDYEDFQVAIVDDASNDGTAERVRSVCKKNGWHYKLEKKNRGALHSQVTAIRMFVDLKPDDVLVFVDGDDRLAHPNVFSRLDYYYSLGARLTYGQYESVPYSATCQLAAAFPSEFIEKGNFREKSAAGYGVYWNHLRTFKYELFSQLTDDDFKNANGDWYKTATDAALMYPCLELARPDIVFIPEVLYLYSSDNMLSDWRRWPHQCDRDHGHILGRTPKQPYRAKEGEIAYEQRTSGRSPFISKFKRSKR